MWKLHWLFSISTLQMPGRHSLREGTFISFYVQLLSGWQREHVVAASHSHHHRQKAESEAGVEEKSFSVSSWACLLKPHPFRSRVSGLNKLESMGLVGDISDSDHSKQPGGNSVGCHRTDDRKGTVEMFGQNIQRPSSFLYRLT